jgi:hypothetical protein
LGLAGSVHERPREPMWSPLISPLPSTLFAHLSSRECSPATASSTPPPPAPRRHAHLPRPLLRRGAPCSRRSVGGEEARGAQCSTRRSLPDRELEHLQHRFRLLCFQRRLLLPLLSGPNPLLLSLSLSPSLLESVDDPRRRGGAGRCRGGAWRGRRPPLLASTLPHLRRKGTVAARRGFGAAPHPPLAVHAHACASTEAAVYATAGCPQQHRHGGNSTMCNPRVTVSSYAVIKILI